MFKDFEYQLLDMGKICSSKYFTCLYEYNFLYFFDLGIFGGSLAILSVIVDFELKKRESESFTTRDLYRMAITCKLSIIFLPI